MAHTITDKHTGERIEGNNPFFQFYKHNFKTMRKAVTENPTAARLFMFLIEHMDNRNAIIISQKALEEALEVSIRTIQMSIKYLVENKYIKVLKSGTSNVYCINADIVWTQRADKKVYAKFEAKVYLTASEQNEPEQVKIRTELQKVATVSKEGNKQLHFLGDDFTVEYNQDQTEATVTDLTVEDEPTNSDLAKQEQQPDTWHNFSGNPDKPIDLDEERIEKLIEKVIRKIW